MSRTLRTSRWFGLVVVAVSIALVGTLSAAKKRPLKNPSFDASAEQVELFDATEKGLIDVTLIPKDSLGGNVFIENKTDKPLTVKVPKAVVAVQILKQFGAGAGLGAGGGPGGGQAGGRNQGGQGGGQQMGGGMGGMGMGGMGMGGMGGMGGGFFSVPPERVVQVPFKSVCLEHGKPEPHTSSTYRLVPVETFSTDPVLKEALEMYVGSDMDPKAAQAAMWNIASKMSWQELASKRYRHIGGRLGETYFSPQQILIGQQLLTRAQSSVREKAKQTSPASTSVTQNSPGAR
jgi:hypothetical protein